MFPALSSLPQFHRAIDARKLAPGLRHYNASLVEHEGEYLLAYRCDDRAGRSSVLLQRLTKKLVPTGDVFEPLAALAKDERIEHEDPRLFIAGGKLFLAYIELNGRHRDGLFTQELVQLDAELAIAQRYDLRIGRNGERTEKNWIFFDAGEGQIGIVYSLRPHRVFLISIDTATILTAPFETPGITSWAFGTLSGSTPALRTPLGYLHFFHSYVPHDRRSRRYSISAAIFNDVAPYAVRLVSAKPLAWASDDDVAIVNPRRPSWNPLCVFAAGLVQTGEDWIVSVGINDTSSALLRFTPEELNLVEPAQVAQSLALSPEDPAPDSADGSPIVRVRVMARANGEALHLVEQGQRYKTNDEFHTTARRADSLRHQVEIVAQ